MPKPIEFKSSIKECGQVTQGIGAILNCGVAVVLVSLYVRDRNRPVSTRAESLVERSLSLAADAVPSPGNSLFGLLLWCSVSVKAACQWKQYHLI